MLRKMEACEGPTGNLSATHSYIQTRWNGSGTVPAAGFDGRRVGSHAYRNLAHKFEDYQDTWIVHCAFGLYEEWAGTEFPYKVYIMHWRDQPGAGVSLGSRQIMLMYDHEFRSFKVVRPGNAGELFGEDVVIGETARGLIEVETWYHLIWKIVIDGTEGAYEIRLNNTVVGSGSGLNTQFTGTAGANQIAFGDFFAVTYQEYAPSALFHDIYILDGQGAAPYNAPIGDIRVRCFRPNGAGASNEWETWGFPEAPTNWESVDDLTANNDTDYVGTSVAGAIDLYNFEDPDLEDNGCYGISVYALGALGFMMPNATIRTKIRIVGASSLYDGPDKALTNSTYVGNGYGTDGVWQINPFTGNNFTEAELIVLQIGVELVITSAGADDAAKVTQMFIDIADGPAILIIAGNVYTDEAQDLNVYAE